MSKEDLALNKLQELICHKPHPNQAKHFGFYTPNVSAVAQSELPQVPFFVLGNLQEI